ncbi:hypothetical protein [Actinocorallia populi]|uniref:hypothetical protein n=1 Tax=Actinocorallia populi TaxID=2079200 RepID=UPI000D092267|nr:hypothetical protein [Actinocorallia populi]
MGGRGLAIVVTVVVLAGALGFGGYRLFSEVDKALMGEGCTATAAAGDIQLEVEQAANAATIAGVAHREKLPRRALVIAYATAEQESHIENLAYGDRDSVGIFQQRPSQGWGTPEQLQDPVYSTTKFFDALVKVDDYAEREVHDAAQLVQRSFDGSLYAQHEGMAEILTTGFAGESPAAITCWYRQKEEVSPRPEDSAAELRRTFGRRFAQDGQAIRLPAKASAATGWSVATWAMTHARTYGFSEVRFDGRRWSPEEGQEGWLKDAAAPADRVLLG